MEMGEKEESMSWGCAGCTFVNHIDLDRCEMCDSARLQERAVETVDLRSPSTSSAALASSSDAQLFPTSNMLMKLLSNAAKVSGLRLRVATLLPDHVTQLGSFGARWSCGYRNIQMLCSSLMQIPQYREVLFGGSGRIPSVWDLQGLIEKAWRAGFDPEGADQLGHRLQGGSTWIGSTECVALLRYYRIRAHIVDFSRLGVFTPLRRMQHTEEGEAEDMDEGSEDDTEVTVGQKRALPSDAKPAAAKGRNTVICPVAGRIGVWVGRYFAGDGLRLPLYFQHQGHSATIVGVAGELQPTVDGREQPPHLIMWDPAHSTQGLYQNLKDALAHAANPPLTVRGKPKKMPTKWRTQLVRPLQRLRDRDYQLVTISPGLVSDPQEYERSKIITSSNA